MKKVLVVGDTSLWLKAVRDALPSKCIIEIARDEIDAFDLQEKAGNHFDLLILSNTKDAGLKILHEARMHGEENPIIIYDDKVSGNAKLAITQQNGIHLTETGDGITGLTRKVKELLQV